MRTIDPPKERECLRCGRRDRWDDTRETWVAAQRDGQPCLGWAHCVHEWDITGNYNPFE